MTLFPTTISRKNKVYLSDFNQEKKIIYQVNWP